MAESLTLKHKRISRINIHTSERKSNAHEIFFFFKKKFSNLKTLYFFL